MAEWAVEVLNDLVEAELLSLPKDMQARFLRISKLLESFGPQRVGLPHVRPLGEKGDALDRKRWNRAGDLHSGGGTAVGRTSRVCKKNAEDAAPCDRFGA